MMGRDNEEGMNMHPLRLVDPNAVVRVPGSGSPRAASACPPGSGGGAFSGLQPPSRGSLGVAAVPSVAARIHTAGGGPGAAAQRQHSHPPVPIRVSSVARSSNEVAGRNESQQPPHARNPTNSSLRHATAPPPAASTSTMVGGARAAFGVFSGSKNTTTAHMRQFSAQSQSALAQHSFSHLQPVSLFGGGLSARNTQAGGIFGAPPAPQQESHINMCVVRHLGVQNQATGRELIVVGVLGIEYMAELPGGV